MKLDIWEAISSILEAGGKFEEDMYVLRNRNGKFHREDGPAIIHQDGNQYWYRNGDLHRDDGPAIIWPDGTSTWYTNGYWLREGE